MAEIDHPLVPRKRPANVSAPDTSGVRIVHRPRFTLSEAVILNLLVNAGPQGVSLGEMRRRIEPFAYTMPSEASIRQHLASIRAKLGEQPRRPTQIVPITKDAFSTGRARVVGYRWQDAPEEDV